jgi:exodeoxyribonuclease VII small subunit
MNTESELTPLETLSQDSAPEKPYEELVKELEQIVRKLESGDITLNQSMELFSRGIVLTKECQRQLDAIENKITVLIQNPDGSITEKPWTEQ